MFQEAHRRGVLIANNGDGAQAQVFALTIGFCRPRLEGVPIAAAADPQRSTAEAQLGLRTTK